jgi:signal transduction histidine kinase
MLCAAAMGNARNVNAAVERVAKIVKALKSFSHFNIGTEKIDANLVEGMETVLTIYQGQTKVGVEVVRNYEDIPLLNCFPDELNQVWTNLIHNALQAMNHEGTLTIGIKEENGYAVVSVGDSGCGIPEEIRGKIFDVFFTTKPAGVGSGLGLDIVKKIIDKHHGRIELQSEVGVGTTFTVMLPYQVVETPEED